jgi:hypothetical protein
MVEEIGAEVLKVIALSAADISTAKASRRSEVTEGETAKRRVNDGGNGVDGEPRALPKD